MDSSQESVSPSSISTKLFDTIALFLTLNKTIDTVYDMNKEEDLQQVRCVKLELSRVHLL